MEDANKKEDICFFNNKLQPQFIPEGLDQNLILKEQEKLFITMRINKLNTLFEKYKEKLNNRDCNTADEKLNALKEYAKETKYSDTDFINDFYELRKAFAYEKQKCMRERILETLKETIGADDILVSTFYNNNDEPYFVKMATIENNISKKQKEKMLEKQKTLCEEIRSNYKRNYVHQNKIRDFAVEGSVREVRNIHGNLAEYEKQKLQKIHEEDITNLRDTDPEAYTKYKEELKQKQFDTVRQVLEHGMQTQAEGITKGIATWIRELCHETTNEYDMRKIQYMVDCYEKKQSACLLNEIPKAKVAVIAGFAQSLFMHKGIENPILIVCERECISKLVKAFSRRETDVIEYEGSFESRDISLERIKTAKQEIVITTHTTLGQDYRVLSNVNWSSVIFSCSNISELKHINTMFEPTLHKTLFLNSSFDSSAPNLWLLINFMNRELFKTSLDLVDYLNAPLAFLNDSFTLTEDEILALKSVMLEYMSSYKFKERIYENSVNAIVIPPTKVQSNLYSIARNLQKRKDDYDRKRMKTMDSNESKIMNDMVREYDMQSIYSKIACHPCLFDRLQNYYKNALPDSLYFASSKVIVLHEIIKAYIDVAKKMMIIFTDHDFMNLFIRFLNERNIAWKSIKVDNLLNCYNKNEDASIYLHLHMQFDNINELHTEAPFDVFIADAPEMTYEFMVGLKHYNTMNCLITKNTHEEKYLYDYNANEPCYNSLFDHPFVINPDFVVDQVILPEIAQSLFEREIVCVKKPQQAATLTDYELRNNLLDKLSSIHKDGYDLIEIFLKLPSREEYPDYYDFIDCPISISEIKEKMNDEDYNLGCMVNDLILMFDNALKYNMEGSQVYKDALYLKKQVQNFYSKNVAK